MYVTAELKNLLAYFYNSYSNWIMRVSWKALNFVREMLMKHLAAKNKSKEKLIAVVDGM